MRNLSGKLALVTGASSGIGRATSEAIAEAGANLILCARREERLLALKTELEKQHKIAVLVLELDVRDRSAVEQKLTALPEGFQNIDILINNAGLSRGLDKFQEASLDDWDEMIDTNVKGLLYVSRMVLPVMVSRGAGDVVNIGSIAGHEVYPSGNVYCATKHAVDAITKSMRIDTNGTGVRIMTIDPGLVETEFSAVRFHGDADRAGKVYNGMNPLSPQDIADAIVWSLSRPAHVQIAEMIILPTDQAAATIVSRR